MKPAPPVTSTDSPASVAFTCPRCSSMQLPRIHRGLRHGGAPSMHSSLRSWESLYVSIDRQKPSCSYAYNSPRSARLGSTALEILAVPQVEHSPVEHEEASVDAMIAQLRFFRASD